MASIRQPAYRGRQLEKWIYERSVFDFEQMTDLPQVVRSALAERCVVLPLTVRATQESDGGSTKKALFELADGHTVEAVLMNYDPTRVSRGRRTVCVSTQAGCAIGCAFCATGKGGFVRHLSAGEIAGQVLYFAAQAGRITNVVFMGQGEPLLNFDAVRRAIGILNSPAGCGLAARNLTVSTAGVVPGIKRLSEMSIQVSLAVSLHAPNDDLRNSLVPLNKKYPIKDLLASCSDYVRTTGRRVTFEYVLVDGVNDRVQHAKELGALLKGHLAHVNLIPMNPVEGLSLRPPTRERIAVFHAELDHQGIPATVRVERGRKILAACGQLQADRPVTVP